MKIYICDDDYAEITWVIKSKDRKAFLKEFHWIDPTIMRTHEVNNLNQICRAICGGTGQYSGCIYKPATGRID